MLKNHFWLKIAGLIFGFYKAFVLQSLWLMVGLVWTIGLLTDKSDDVIVDDLR